MLWIIGASAGDDDKEGGEASEWRQCSERASRAVHAARCARSRLERGAPARAGPIERRGADCPRLHARLRRGWAMLQRRRPVGNHLRSHSASKGHLSVYVQETTHNSSHIALRGPRAFFSAGPCKVATTMATALSTIPPGAHRRHQHHHPMHFLQPGSSRLSFR